MNLIKHIFTSCSYTSCLAYRPKVKKTFQVGCGIWIMTFGHQFYIWASFINSFGPFLKFGLFWLLGPHRERGRHEFRVELFRLVFRLQRDQVPITYYSFLSFFFKKMGHPRPFYRLFSALSNKHHNFLQQYNVKNVHPVSGAGIWTHGLLDVSLLP